MESEAMGITEAELEASIFIKEAAESDEARREAMGRLATLPDQLSESSGRLTARLLETVHGKKRFATRLRS